MLVLAHVSSIKRPLRVEPRLRYPPPRPAGGHVGPVLLGGLQDFFSSVSFIFRNALQSV